MISQQDIQRFFDTEHDKWTRRYPPIVFPRSLYNALKWVAASKGLIVDAGDPLTYDIAMEAMRGRDDE